MIHENRLVNFFYLGPDPAAFPAPAGWSPLLSALARVKKDNDIPPQSGLESVQISVAAKLRNPQNNHRRRPTVVSRQTTPLSPPHPPLPIIFAEARGAKPSRPPSVAKMARVYADVNQNMPRAYWDYDSVNISEPLLPSSLAVAPHEPSHPFHPGCNCC